MTSLGATDSWHVARRLRRFHRSTLAWLLAAMGALVVVVINETIYNKATDSLAELTERATARVEARLLMSLLIDAEAAQRGYLLTERKVYLEPYDAAVAQVGEVLMRLHALYVDDPSMLKHVGSIDRKTQEKLAVMATTLAHHAQGQHAQWRAMLGSDLGKSMMDDLRTMLGAVVAYETERVVAQRKSLYDTFKLNRIVVNLMVAFTLLAVILFLRETQLRGRAQDEHAGDLRLERDQLELEVTRRTTELRDLAQHLQTVREDERGHLARELHDELGGLLTAAKMDSARLKRSLGSGLSPGADKILQHLNSTVDQVITLKRRIIEDLRPSALSNLGLLSTVQIQIKEFRDTSELQVHALLAPVVLTPRAQMTVYRVIQESLTNIAKHAQATEVTVTLGAEGNQVLLSIEDNGCGFDPNVVKPSSHGLTGMRYRVESEGGRVSVTTQPGRGTQLAVSLPSAMASAVAS